MGLAGAADGWLVPSGVSSKDGAVCPPQACNSWPSSAPCLRQTSVTSSTVRFQLDILNCALSDSRDLLCVHPITTHHNYLLVMTGRVKSACSELCVFVVVFLNLFF